MHDYLNEIIDRLIDSGMNELEAIELITLMLEEEAKEFIYWQDYFDDVFSKPFIIH